MGGFFGVASKEDCVLDVFYGVDYHSHLGTRRGCPSGRTQPLPPLLADRKKLCSPLSGVEKTAQELFPHPAAALSFSLNRE